VENYSPTTWLALGGCAASRAITQDDDAVYKSMDAHPGTDVYVQCASRNRRAVTRPTTT
jgi:Ni,Fe-hydrogenase III small subunit